MSRSRLPIRGGLAEVCRRSILAQLLSALDSDTRRSLFYTANRYYKDLRNTSDQTITDAINARKGRLGEMNVRTQFERELDGRQPKLDTGTGSL